MHGLVPTTELQVQYFAVRFSSETEKELCVGGIRFAQG
jgi:hypothetical protein